MEKKVDERPRKILKEALVVCSGMKETHTDLVLKIRELENIDTETFREFKCQVIEVREEIRSLVEDWNESFEVVMSKLEDVTEPF